MAPLVPGITFSDAQEMVGLLGWEPGPQEGSHVPFTHTMRPGMKVTIPNHPGQDINPVTMGVIVGNLGLERDQFLRLRGKGHRRYARELKKQLGL